MKNFKKLLSIFKILTISELVVIITLFVGSVGWVYQVNAQMRKGCERDDKMLVLEKEIQTIKIDVAEIKTSNKEIGENVKLLLVRGLNARYNQ
mgnify:FL=1